MGVGTVLNILFCYPQTDSFFFCLFARLFFFAITALVINFTGNFSHLVHISRWIPVHPATSGELKDYGGRRRLRKSPLFLCRVTEGESQSRTVSVAWIRPSAALCPAGSHTCRRHCGAKDRPPLTPLSAADIKGPREVIQSDGVTLTTAAAAAAASRCLSARLYKSQIVLPAAN